MGLRAEARQYARLPIPQDVLTVLAAVSEYCKIPLWKMRAIWNRTPEYRKPGALEGLQELVRKVQSGEVVLDELPEDSPRAG